MMRPSFWTVNHRSLGAINHTGVRIEISFTVRTMSITFRKNITNERGIKNLDVAIIIGDDPGCADSFFAATLLAHRAFQMLVKLFLKFNRRSQDVLLPLEKCSYLFRVHGI